MEIIIVDDHFLVAAALKELIEIDNTNKVLKHCSNGLELKNYLENNGKHPDLILLDINMPIMNGVDTLSYLKSNFPTIKVVILTMNDNKELIIKLIKMGANGFVLKSSTFDELNATLLSIKVEDTYFSNYINKLLISEINDTEKAILNPKLSLNETKFIKLICSDMTYKEIADKLNLSPKTIDGYRDSLFSKLNIKSRTGLVLFAIQNEYYKI